MNKNLLITRLVAVCCICFCFALSSQAQTDVKFGVKAGFNASSISGMEDLYKKGVDILGSNMNISTSYKAGFHIGLISQIGVSESFFVQPELLYSMQGNKEKETSRNIKGNNTLHYIQLPIYAGYKIHAGQGLDVILGAGPYVAYGVAATDEAKGAFDSNSNFQLKRFDFGLSAMGGVQFNQFQITIGYDLGLTDIVDMNGWKTAKDLAGLSSICNRNFKASVAYLF